MFKWKKKTKKESTIVQDLFTEEETKEMIDRWINPSKYKKS